MRVVDLTQPWGDRMPTWPQFASIKVTDITTHHRDRKSTVLVETNMHTGTHIDAPIHYAERGRDLSQIPIQDLIGTGLVIDLRPITKPWSYYSLDDVLSCVPKGEEIREGDVVVLYTGWDQYNWTKPTRDDVTYFDRHPGPKPEVVDYLIHDRKIKWIGGDLASMDHSMYVRIRWMRPDLVKEFEQMYGGTVEELVPERDFEYVHYTTARNNVCMLENLGGEIAEVAGKRCTMGAFPWRWVGGEGCICRVVAFLDMDQPGIDGSEPAGAQPRQWDAGTTPARIMASGDTKVTY
jgi:arylformamidase